MTSSASFRQLPLKKPKQKIALKITKTEMPTASKRDRLHSGSPKSEAVSRPLLHGNTAHSFSKPSQSHGVSPKEQPVLKEPMWEAPTSLENEPE